MIEAKERLTLTVPEVARLLGISRASAYNLARQKSFPALRISRRLVVPKAAFERWLARETGEQEA